MKRVFWILLFCLSYVLSIEAQTETVELRVDSMINLATGETYTDTVFYNLFSGATFKTKPKGLCLKNQSNNHLEYSGIYLKKSATLDCLAISTCLIGSGIMIVGATVDLEDIFNVDLRKARPIFYGVGGVFVLTGIICESFSIHYKWKSGQELRLHANGIRYNF